MARGDHIKVRRIGYSHHGIDIGDGTVVHFSGEPFRVHEAQVVREPMALFLHGGSPRVVHYKEAVRSADEVAEAALAHLGMKGYHIWRNNCEHFACFCKTGRRWSSQTERAAKAVVAVGAGMLAATSVGVATLGATVAVGALRRIRRTRRYSV